MINVLIMTHGGLAEGVCDSAAMILGQQKGLEWLSFEMDWSLDKLVAELLAHLDSYDRDDPVLVLLDVFGGTPSNAIALALGGGRDLYAVTGVNLPMLLEVLTNRDGIGSPEELVRVAVEAGKNGIIDVRAMLTE